MNNRIALIVLYFGKLPEYFELFIRSLESNPQADLLLYTDQKTEVKSDRLIVKNCSFKDMVARIQSKFDFEIRLNRPYKFCDFKPAYGYIFADELQNYGFWGYCDLDMILGNLGKFLTDEILQGYDKFYQLGHLTAFRNTPENNERFMRARVENADYKKAFTTDIICVFDEGGGIQKIYDGLGVKSYLPRDCADITPRHENFRRSVAGLEKTEIKGFNAKYQLFFWQDGGVYRASYKGGKIVYDEFNYIHLAKRKMPVRFTDIAGCRSFFITRKGFISREAGFSVSLKEIKKLNGVKFWGELKFKISHSYRIWKRRINKYLFKR